MRTTRRQFAQLIAATVSAQASPLESEWTLGNDSFQQRVTLRDGSFLCASIVNRRTGREWIHPALPSEEFMVECCEPAVALTGKGPLRYLRHERKPADKNWTELTIELRSDSLPLVVVRRYLWHRELPVVRQQTILRNDGEAVIAVRRCDSFRLRVGPVPEPLELAWMNDFGRAMLPNPGNPIHRSTIEENVRQLVRSGPYSPDCGWFALTIPGKSEGLVGGWEWSGPMVVAFGDQRDPCLIHGGLDPEVLAESLAPGAVFPGPVGWYGFFEGGLDEASRLSHRLVEELAPALPQEKYPWVGYCSWAASLDEDSSYNHGAHPWFPTEDNLLSQVDAAADLGCDMFLWDYGWFPRVGDWWCDRGRFPEGPRRVAQQVKKSGMKLGLWVGFGNADDDSQVVQQHPDWLATYGGKPIPDNFFTRTAASTWRTRTLCLAHRPARQWVKEQLSRVIEEFELDWFKHDFDLITICQNRHHSHTPGDSRVASCEAFYEIMDFVRSRYPDLVCENWMNNSAVPDYGVLQRHHAQLIGDAYQPFLLRQMFYGHTQIFPPDRQHRYIRFEGATGDFRTMVRSGSIGGPWTVLSDPRRMTRQQRDTLRQEIDLYKRHRGLLHGAFVHRLLGRPHPRGWDATEFFNPSLGQGLLYVFRGDHETQMQAVALRGLVEMAAYQVINLDTGHDETISGRELKTRGVSVKLAQPGSSAMFSIRRVRT